MAIEIGAMITAISQRDIAYMGGEPPVLQHIYIRDVTLQVVGLPPQVPPVVFTVAVNDATQWDQLQVGKTVTVSLIP